MSSQFKQKIEGTSFLLLYNFIQNAVHEKIK